MRLNRGSTRCGTVKKITDFHYIFFTIKFILLKFSPNLINSTKILVLGPIENKNGSQCQGVDEVTMLSDFGMAILSATIADSKAPLNVSDGSGTERPAVNNRCLLCQSFFVLYLLMQIGE